MAAVYKALSKSDNAKPEHKTNGIPKENRQRLLMLTSRGVTFRYVAIRLLFRSQRTER